MTPDIDKLISEALEEDERELLEKIGNEPGYFAQAFSIFRGPRAWVIWLMYIFNIISFIGFVYAAWHFFGTDDPILALRWGLSALVLFKFASFAKGAMGIHGETNRILREVRRLELQVLKLRADGTARS